MLPYKILALLLYPREPAIIQATSWTDRVFYLSTLSRRCNTDNRKLRKQLEYLRQAGFITKVKYLKEPGYSGRLWAKVGMKMPAADILPPWEGPNQFTSIEQEYTDE